MRLVSFALVAGLSLTSVAASQQQEQGGGHRIGDRATAAALGIEWGGPDAPIRPGGNIPGCTLNFAFLDEVTGTAYMGTAAHCTELGERMSASAYGEFGTVVFDSDEDLEGNADLVHVDFSLIEVDPELVSEVDPEMLTWGGPVGYVTPDDLSAGDTIVIHGYGLGVGSSPYTRGNRGGLLVTWDEDEYVADMAAVNGDSGASLLHLDSGMALGIISRWNLGDNLVSTDTGPMLPFIFEALAASGFDNVVLATTT